MDGNEEEGPRAKLFNDPSRRVRVPASRGFVCRSPGTTEDGGGGTGNGERSEFKHARQACLEPPAENAGARGTQRFATVMSRKRCRRVSRSRTNSHCPFVVVVESCVVATYRMHSSSLTNARITPFPLRHQVAGPSRALSAPPPTSILHSRLFPSQL